MARRSAPDLRRRRHRQQPKRRFIVYCEGAKTEPAYLAALRAACRGTLIEMKVIGPAGVPKTLARQAAVEARSNRRGRNSFEKNDQVWAVFDRDEHPHYSEAVKHCEDAGVRVGRSNPCFEIWLILHEEDYDKPDDRHAVQARLRTIRPEYCASNGKTVDCNDLVTRVDAAEQRAAVLLARREAEGQPYGPPSTTVGHLTRAIRDAAQGL